MELVLSILTFLNKIMGIGQPILDEATIHKHENEAQAQYEEWQSILDQPEGDGRRNSIAGFMGRVCNEIGHPPGRLSGRSIEVPVEYFHASVLGNIDSIKVNKALEHSEAALQKISKS